MSKSALFWIITVSAVLLFGSYFFIAGDKNQKNDPIKTYTSKDRERPKIKVEKNILLSEHNFPNYRLITFGTLRDN